MVLWCALKLDTGYVDSGASCEELWYRHKSATASVLPGATGMSYKVIYSWFAVVSWERLSCELRPASTSAGHEAV